MASFFAEHYLLIKALHVISVMAWMAGLLYLPRLFVYHADAAQNSDQDKTFQIMELRLLRIIMNPAMICAWLFGLLMLWANPALLENGWMHMKMACIILITILHQVFAYWRKNFAAGANKHPAKFYKLWNEAPTVLMVVIVLMAVWEPF